LPPRGERASTALRRSEGAVKVEEDKVGAKSLYEKRLKGGRKEV
jgi:hypothetical protein